MSDTVILWIIAGLVAIFGFVFIIHLGNYKEFTARVVRAIEQLHEIDKKVSAMLQRWIDQDRDKK